MKDYIHQLWTVPVFPNACQADSFFSAPQKTLFFLQWYLMAKPGTQQGARVDASGFTLLQEGTRWGEQD